jgi:hypothetical protein
MFANDFETCHIGGTRIALDNCDGATLGSSEGFQCHACDRWTCPACGDAGATECFDCIRFFQTDLGEQLAAIPAGAAVPMQLISQMAAAEAARFAA